ncbi:phosphate acyltransferase PlsX, partial [bacterium]|nr:phosphate acyltransferase PlsX [bacterium]
KAPVEEVAGAVEAVNQNPNLKVLLTGRQKLIGEELVKYKYDSERIEVFHAEERITMDDPPGMAVRRKKKSSLHLANQLVKAGKAQAVFTAGNTGAAMAVSLLHLGRIPGIIRPALLINLPSLNRHGWTSILDVGANVDTKPKMLAQFALMGELYCRHVMKVNQPRVGLLSVGRENSKGNELIRQSWKLIAGLKNIKFIGNVEGQDILEGRTDVVVCDGFVGNVLLKFGEGSIRLFGELIKQQVKAGGWLTKISIGMFIPILRAINRRVDYQEYGSAPLLGINGISTIGHGKSSRRAIRSALLQGVKFIEEHINFKIEAALKGTRMAEK